MTTTQAAPASTGEATQRVLDRHLQAFAGADVETIMRDYTVESVVFTPERTFRGRAEIRGFFEGAMQMFPANVSKLDVQRVDVEGEVAYVAWAASTPVVDVPAAVDTFVIRDDRILVQTFGGHIIPKG